MLRYGTAGGMVALAVAAAGVAVALAAPPAFAHGAERGLVLLLPSGHAMLGGAAAVALTFLLLAAVPAAGLRRLAGAGWRLGRWRRPPAVPLSLASFVALAALVAAGTWGPGDPLHNPLPLVIWALFWAGLPVVQALTGSLWPWLNPWSGPLALLARASGGRLGRQRLLVLPRRWGYLPAITGFLAFAWVEVVSLAPEDPPRLAWLVAAFWVVQFAGFIVFGRAAWTARGEPFGILFALVGRLSPLRRRAGRLWICWPGQRLCTGPRLPPSGVVFALLALGTGSFDGLSHSFAWAGLLGINPLEFPGRSAVIAPNTLGLLAAPLLLAAAFRLAVGAGAQAAGGPARGQAGDLVMAAVPIAVAFHFAHMLTLIFVNGQYAAVALSDPLGRGWDLFGTAEWPVSAAAFSDMGAVRRIWAVQTAAIVLGHAIAILVGHLIALRHWGDARRAAISQAPLAAAMVGYTLFGLWLLSTPVIG